VSIATAFVAIAAIPFIYYFISLYSSWRYFRQSRMTLDSSFTPPVSCLKPMRGLDPEAYENLASFCVQDYPDYEIVFCVDPDDQPVRDVIDKLQRDFPQRKIRVLLGSGRVATNDKTAKLSRLVSEAAHETVVISDSDVRVRPDYLRNVVAPLANPKIGATTPMYVPTEIRGFTDQLQTAGMMSDFYPGILVAWQLDGVKFALGTTIATTRARLEGFGGYRVLENRPADDLLVGRLIADQGYEVALLSYLIETVPDYSSLKALLHKRLRWIVVMRHMRPWGHFGLLWTQGLAWSVAAAIVSRSWEVAAGFFGAYLIMRIAMTWMIAIHGLKQARFWKHMPLIPLWDAVAFGIWVVSFFRTSIRWRGGDYYIREGQLVRVAPPAASTTHEHHSA
jgi:ceramide glucosyltransferase